MTGTPAGRGTSERLRIAGATWLLAAGFGIAMTLIFRIDPVQWAVTIGAGVVAAAVGILLIARPSTAVAYASNIVALVWALLYALLAVQQSSEPAAWITDVALVVIGVVAGLVTYRATRAVK